jgi:hypothetical protein
MSATTTDLERLILLSIDKDGSIPNSKKFAQQHNIDHEKLVGTLNSLKLGAEMIDLENKSEKAIRLSKTGEKVRQDGASPEVLFFKALPAQGKVEKEEFKKIATDEVEKLGFGKAKQNKWVDSETDKSDAKNVKVHYFRTADNVVDTLLQLINKLVEGKDISAEELKTLKQRKMADEE